jgi:CRP/FNR family transcriptional regulator, cyclic AMP receptor protein
LRKRAKSVFDPKNFLSEPGEGKFVASYRRGEIVFLQGEIASAVFYIQQGKVKLTVFSKQGKEAVIAFVEPGHFLEKDA